MQIIIDTSVVIAILFNEKSKQKLVTQTVEATLIAPFSLHWEIGNAISAMLKRKRIKLSEAAAAINQYNEIPIRFIDVSLSKSLEIAVQYNTYAYDAYFLAAAKKNKLSLLSLDQKLHDIAIKMGIKVLEV
jgi:predicted nucleic acid-binding protein